MAYQSVTFQPGTLIIPMDTISQDNGMYRAYGLIYKFLYNNVINPSVPIFVYWAINPIKTSFTTVDFIAPVREFGTADVPVNYSYTGGPFIIDITPQNQALVEQIINDWNSADPNPPAVFIHELVNSPITVETAAKLIRPPRISIEDKNNGIVRPYLDEAGIPDYYTVFPNIYSTPIPPEWDDKDSPSILSSEQIDAGAFFGNTADFTCRKLAYDIFISPHTGEDVWTKLGNTLPELDQFLQLGGHLHSMCESIVSIENNAYFLTSTGIKEENKGEDFFINQSEAENPLLQAVSTGNVQDLPGGSVQTWNEDETGNNPVNYLPATKIFAYFEETKDDVTTQYDFMVGGPYQGSTFQPNNPGAGAIVYEGGHSYETKIPYTDKMDALYYKFLLNSVFLSVTKPLLDLSFTPNAIVAGSTNNYNFSIKNIGGGQAINSNITVTLLPNMSPSNYNILPSATTGTIPTGLTLIWNGITLDGGEAITFDVLNYTDPGSPGEYPIGFTATYGDDFFSTPQNPLTLNTCTSLAVLPADSPFLLVEKQVDGNLQTSILEGGTVTFTYTVTNVGDQPAYDIELVDPNLFDFFTFTLLDVTPAPSFIDTINKKIIFPSGTIVPPGLVIPPAPGPGNVLIITVIATHNAAVPPTQILNQATVNYVNYFDPQQPIQLTSLESNIATTNIVVPDIDGLKTVDKLNAAIGDILTYTIEITNPGNTIINSVLVKDTIPAGTSYVASSLNVTANVPITTTVIQTSPQIQVQIDGTLNPISPDPDVQTDKIIVTFQVIVNSIISNPVTNSALLEYVYQIAGEETGTDSKESNTVETNIASIIVTKSAPSAVQLGQTMLYTIAINNNGEVPLQNVVVNDTIPNETTFISATANGANIVSQIVNNKDITLVLDLIPVNSTITIDILVSVDILPPDPYEIYNSAIVIFSIDQEEKPPVESNEVTTVVGEAVVEVTKGTVGDILNAVVGETVTYSVVVTNNGNVPITLTTLTDIIQQAANTSFQDDFRIEGVPLVPQPVSLNNVDLTTASPLNIVAPGNSVTITYDVRIDSLPQDEKIDNTVTIDFEYQIGQERFTGEGEDSYTVFIQQPDINVLKSVDKINAIVGDILTYTVEITNPGTVNIDSILFTDTIPTGTSYVANSLNVTANIPIITTVIQTTPQIIVRVNGQLKPITDTIIIEFQVQVDSLVSNPIINSGTVDYDYKVDPNGPIITGTEQSNIIETNLASLLITKEAPAFVELGEDFIYTIRLQNNGIVPLQNVVVKDVIPNETSFVSAVAIGGNIISQTVIGKEITLVIDSILPGNTVDIEITVHVDVLPPAPYEIDNSAIVIITVDQEEKPPIESNEVTSIVEEGAIIVTKGTVGDISNAAVGETVTYSVIVTNTGNVPVTLTTLTDIIQQAANTSFQDNFRIEGSLLIPQPVSLNNVNLTTAFPLNIVAPGNSVTITYDVRIDSLPQDEKIDNTVTINFEYQIGQERFTGEGEDSYTIFIQQPDINVLKSVDKINAVVGDILTYRVEITNPGTVNIDSILFTDTIPPGTSYVANSLNVTANIPIATTVIQTTPQIIVRVNGQLKPITDTIIIEFQVQVDSLVSNPIINSGTVDYDYKVDPNGPIITETEQSNIIETNLASLLITKEAPAFVELGEDFIYTIRLQNNGIVPLQNIVVKDVIPNETSFVSATAIGGNIVSQTVVGKEVTLVIDTILPGNTVDIEITVHVDVLPPAPYEIDNSAIAILTVDQEEKPPIESNEVTSIVGEGQISVTKGTDGDIQYAKVGDTVTYSVDIINTGNVPVTLTTLTDVIQQAANTSFQDQFRIDGGLVLPQPLNLNNVILNETLQPQDSIRITYNIRIESLPQGKVIDNTVTIDFVYQIGQDRKTGQGEDSFTLNVEEIEVNLIKEVDKAFAEPGEELLYTFTIENNSSVPITNVYLYDPLPPNTTFVEGSFSLNPTENPTIFPGAFIGTIPSNSQVVASFKVRINEELTSAVNIPNQGSVTYNYKLDPNEPGEGQQGGPENSNEVNTQVEIAEIKLMKSVSDEFAEVGDIITYTVTVENTGTVDAIDVEVIDILPPELQFIPGTLVVTPQQPGDTVTGTDPSYVKISIIRANPNVATIVFDAKVISRPISGKINNIAHGNFKYSLDPLELPTLSKTNIPSNEVSTTIQIIEVTILKTADNGFVEVGENLTYTIQLTNHSTVPVDIKFTDTLPGVTEYVTGSFNLISGTATVTNNTLPNATLIDVDIVNMLPQSSVIFSYKIKVLSLPPSQEITNQAKAVPSYRLYPDGPIREGEPVEDEVTTPVKLIKLDVIKAVDKLVATIGDILQYTVTIINNGNTIAENVVFSDNVPAGTTFVEGSLTVDDVAVDARPEEGVEVGNIVPGQIITIKFNVEVVAIPEPPNEPKVENIALVTFDVELDDVLEPQDPVVSNPVETELLKVQLEAVKTVDKEIANVGDILTYTVVITNTGDVTIDNVIFSDQIPDGTVLVGSQPVQNVNLGSILPGESKTVTFQVKIVSKICPPKLINKATIRGTYLIETSRIISIESNEVITYVNVRMFKQISVDENLTIPSQKPDMEDILEVIVDVEITYTNVIETPVVTSYEGQILTGWKLIVEGKLKQKIVYIADEPTQSVHAAEFDVPFSTFIVLSGDYKKCMQLKVEGIIEDVFIKQLDKRRIFKNVTLLIEARKGC